ncbi:MAG: DUF4296 domain-containing protein [Bacteroidetes bacterium]|nr:DUF4296 domain-containing protein [Bacteroidota bacterium]
MQKLSILFLWLALISCTANKKPNDVLSQAQLSALLVDVYVSEARVDVIPGLKDSTIRYFLPREQKLLKEKGISDSVLRKTYAYYLEHPKELEQVYDAVIDTLTVHEQRAMKINAPKPVK